MHTNTQAHIVVGTCAEAEAEPAPAGVFRNLIVCVCVCVYDDHKSTLEIIWLSYIHTHTHTHSQHLCVYAWEFISSARNAPQLKVCPASCRVPESPKLTELPTRAGKSMRQLTPPPSTAMYAPAGAYHKFRCDAYFISILSAST